MKREPLWRRYLRFWGPDPEGDVRDEFSFHLETKIEELISAGMRADDARREAERQFGPLHPVQTECYRISKRRQDRASFVEYLGGWWRDVQYAFRVLRKNRASTAVALLIFAVGIGATTAVFTLLDQMIYRPLPVREPSKLVFVSTTERTPPYDAYANLRDQNQTLSGLAAVGGHRVSEHRQREKIANPAIGIAVSGNFFDILGITASVGRTLTPSDDRAGAANMAVISHRFWTRRYGQKADALGGVIHLRDIPFTIVGVLPERFYGLSKGRNPDVYFPLWSLREMYDLQETFGSTQVEPVGRLKPGTTLEQAESNLQVLWSRFLSEWAPSDPLGQRRLQQFLKSRIDCKDASTGYAGASGEAGLSLKLLAAIVGILLLMGCANVACLLIARGGARRHEIATRLALGASAARILRASLVETCLLAVAGGAAGFAASYWFQRLLLSAFQWQDRPIDLSPDWRVAGFGLGVSLLTGLLCGFIPAIQLLRGGQIGPSQRVVRFGSGTALVVVQIALSLTMVAGAAVFLRSYENLRSVPLGFSAENVSVMILEKQDPESSETPIRPAVELAAALRGVAGIEAAAVADLATFSGVSISYPVRLRGEPADGAQRSNVLLVGPDYFAALRTRLLLGRGFTERDSGTAPRVAVLGESLAHRLFPGQNAVGQTVRLTDQYEAEVVGVAEDIKYGTVKEAPPNLIYLSAFHSPGDASSGVATIQIRSRFPAGDVAELVRERIRAQSLAINLYSFSALADNIGASYRQDRIRMLATGAFSVLALFLITAGIYGLMAYSVARRTREIGVRMAVGSTSGSIQCLVLKESSRLIVLGIIAGVPGALAVMKAISGVVFGLSPIDGISLTIAVLLVSVTGFVASIGPARRAARLDPVNALRME